MPQAGKSPIVVPIGVLNTVTSQSRWDEINHVRAMEHTLAMRYIMSKEYPPFEHFTSTRMAVSSTSHVVPITCIGLLPPSFANCASMERLLVSTIVSK